MYTTHLTIIKGKSETKALMHLARSIYQGRGLRFPCNDRTDEVYKLSYGLSIMDLTLRSIKTNRWSADNFNKHVTSMRCTLELAIQSCDTGQRIPFFKSCQSTITWMSIRMSTIKHLASNVPSLQENSQSECAYYCSHIILKIMHCLTSS